MNVFVNHRYITDKEVDYVQKSFNEGMTCKEIAEKLGVKMYKVYDIKSHPDTYREKYAYVAKIRKERETVASLYETHSIKEIAKITGISENRVKCAKYALGLQHNEETKERIKRETLTFLKSEEHKKDISNILRKIHRMEVMRVMSGLPQKTKRLVKKTPTRVRKAANRITHDYNYFRLVDEYGAYTIFYDSETRRKLTLEKRYEERYGFKFAPADDYKEDNNLKQT